MPALFITNTVHIQRYADAVYGVVIGSTTLAQVNADITARGGNIDTALNAYFASSATPNATVATNLVKNIGIAVGTGSITAQQVTDAVTYVTALLNANKGNEGATIKNLLNTYANATADATYGAAVAKFNLDVDNALAYTGSIDSATGVTGSAPFALTTGVDNKSLSGTFQADLLFNPGTGTQVQSLQTGDTLTGTGTADILNAALNGTATTPTVTGVETINVSTFASTTLGAGGITGVTTLNSTVVAGAVETITGLIAGVRLGLTGAGTLTSNQASETGTTNVQVYSLSGAVAATITGSAAVEKQDFISTGSAANSFILTNITAATNANKTAVTGDQSLTIRMAGNAPFSGLFIDGSGMTGSANLTLRMDADQVAQTTDLNNFTGVTKVLENIRDTGTTTYTNYKSGLQLEFGASNGTNHIATNLVATNAGLTGNSDVLSLRFVGVGGSGGVGGTTNAAGVETLNILGSTTATTQGTLTFTGTTTLTAGSIGKTSTIVIDAATNQAVTFTGNVTADALNASGLTKTLTVGGTASQMAITGGSGNDSVTIGAFASVINTGTGTDTINVSALTGTTASTINGGDGVDSIIMAAGAGTDTIIFGASSTWGDTVTEFELNDAAAVDVINLSVSNGFGVLKHGTTASGITYGEGTGTTFGNNDTIFVSTTAAATATTVAGLLALGTFSTGTTAVGDHVVLVVNNTANSTTASGFTVFDIVAGDTNGLITSADTVSLIGVFTGANAGTGSATLADWSAASFSVA